MVPERWLGQRYDYADSSSVIPIPPRRDIYIIVVNSGFELRIVNIRSLYFKLLRKIYLHIWILNVFF